MKKLSIILLALVGLSPESTIHGVKTRSGKGYNLIEVQEECEKNPKNVMVTICHIKKISKPVTTQKNAREAFNKLNNEFEKQEYFDLLFNSELNESNQDIPYYSLIK